MKKPALLHKLENHVRRSAALLLCCVLAVSCCALPASAAPGDAPPPVSSAVSPEEEVSQPESAPESEAGKGNASPVLTESEGSSPETDTPEESEPSGEPEESGPSGEPEVPAKIFTLTFRLGSFGAQTVQVEEGQYPPEIPSIPELPAASVLGWFDEAGEQVEPDTLPAERDAVYTARWSRQVSDLLNTDEHTPYISGYDNGMFKPQNGITRAEAAQLFYNLLRSRDWEQKSFADVPAAQWYAQPVGVMAGLGVLNGYSDGTFRPNHRITRAEFVKMAVTCDTISGGENPFSDVPENSWAETYIITAASKGWINGYQDGTFRPDGTITRAEAVSVLNRILGRAAEAGVKEKPGVKNFYDVFPTNWAYGAIVEASTSHAYSREEETEVWGDYERDESTVEKSRWVRDGSTRYYLDASTRKFLRGAQTIDGVKYLLDSSTGAAVTGFRTEGAWRRYYKNGVLQNDLSGLGVVSGPYFIKVYKSANYLILFARDENGDYNIPVRSMLVSCGYGTPTGTYYTPYRYRWLKMMGDTYAQWCTQIQGNYLFHSVPNWTYNNFDLEVGEYNHLGDTRSMGCIRLNCRDAKWIYDNCVLGTEVYISATETSGPLGKPAGLQIPSWHTWDPTDPTAYWKCQQNGCH